MFQNVLLFMHLKMFKISCMLNVIYYNKFTMRSMLFCVTQNNNNSLGNAHVDNILLDQLGFHS